jgi:hypothetical protein
MIPGNLRALLALLATSIFFARAYTVCASESRAADKAHAVRTAVPKPVTITSSKGAEQLAEWHITQACNLMKANDPYYVDRGRAHLNSAKSIGLGTLAGIKAERFLKHNWPKMPVPRKIVEKHTDAVKVSDSAQSERLWRECIKECPTFEHPYNGLGQQLLKQGNRRARRFSRRFSNSIQTMSDHT